MESIISAHIPDLNCYKFATKTWNLTHTGAAQSGSKTLTVTLPTGGGTVTGNPDSCIIFVTLSLWNACNVASQGTLRVQIKFSTSGITHAIEATRVGTSASLYRRSVNASAFCLVPYVGQTAPTETVTLTYYSSHNGNEDFVMRADAIIVPNSYGSRTQLLQSGVSMTFSN